MLNNKLKRNKGSLYGKYAFGKNLRRLFRKEI